jgi:hypothetical protein
MDTEEKKAAAIAKPMETGFAIIDDPRARELVVGAFEQMGISDFQLTKLKIPGGGSTAFMVETLEGEVPMQEVEGVIIYLKGQQKVWWKESIDVSTSPSEPDCKSTDGKRGYGINTLDEGAEPGEHDCMKCHWNQFGSTRSGGTGRGKDCKDSTHVFFFQKGNRLPTLLTAPATSISVVNSYYMKLLDAGKGIEQVITKIGLESVKGGGGGSYSKLTLTYGGDLDTEAATAISGLAKELKPFLGNFDAFSDSSD